MAFTRKLMKGLTAIASTGVIALSACGGWDGGTGGSGGSGGSNGKTQCYQANVKLDSGLVYVWHADGSYGSNHFFLHKLADTCEDAENCFPDGTPVKGYVLKEGESIPDSVWQAGRPFGGDGNDPRKFTDDDSFIIGYLPWIPKSFFGWKNDHAEYDWRCAEGDEGETNGLENCIGLSQLDKTFTLNTLEPGKNYLARLLFGANVNGENEIGFCNQAVFKYEK